MNDEVLDQLYYVFGDPQTLPLGGDPALGWIMLIAPPVRTVPLESARDYVHILGQYRQQFYNPEVKGPSITVAYHTAPDPVSGEEKMKLVHFPYDVEAVEAIEAIVTQIFSDPLYGHKHCHEESFESRLDEALMEGVKLSDPRFPSDRVRDRLVYRLIRSVAIDSGYIGKLRSFEPIPEGWMLSPLAAGTIQIIGRVKIPDNWTNLVGGEEPESPCIDLIWASTPEEGATKAKWSSVRFPYEDGAVEAIMAKIKEIREDPLYDLWDPYKPAKFPPARE